MVNKIDKVLIIIIDVIYFIYCLLTLIYVLIHQLIENKKHFIIFWFDFLIILISYFIYIIFITIDFYNNEISNSKNNIISIIFISYFFINFIVCIKIIIKIFKFYRIDIKNDETKNLIKKINNLNIIGIYNKIYHFIIIMIFFFLILFIILKKLISNETKIIIIKITSTIQIILCLIF